MGERARILTLLVVLAPLWGAGASAADAAEVPVLPQPVVLRSMPQVRRVTRPLRRKVAATPTATPTPTFTPTSTPTFTPKQPSPVITFRPSGQNPLSVAVAGVPPAQKLPSAFLIYPLIRATATQDTLIEIVNLTAGTVSLQCFYVTSDTCNEVGFFTSLTGNQPLAWKASSGNTGNGARIAPPFRGEGELKCVVQARVPDLSAHNALQGRAIVSDVNGDTIGYAASAFRRLSPGTFDGEIALDGVTYEQCPDRLHFNAMSGQSGSDSELILVPCSEDLVNQVAATSPVQFAVVNEFEQNFSGSTNLSCFLRKKFSNMSFLTKSGTGTNMLHVVVRAVDVPVVGLVIDRFSVPGGVSVSSNDPYLEGGRSALVSLP